MRRIDVLLVEQSNAMHVTAEAFTTDELAHHNAEEITHYRRNRRHKPNYPGFGLELFRRAVVEQDEAAWSIIYEQYSGLVRCWVTPADGDEDELIAATFERFWRAVGAEKFRSFASLGTILQYLKLCARTARLDWDRAAARQTPEEPLAESLDSVAVSEEAPDARVTASDVWRVVQQCLPDARERDVLYLSYAQGLCPREICVRYGTRFPRVKEVYRLKGNALDRLRNRPEMRALL
jgi:DNA-directed RNA polymerase specialized sigma24 family protein